LKSMGKRQHVRDRRGGREPPSHLSGVHCGVNRRTETLYGALSSTRHTCSLAPWTPNCQLGWTRPGRRYVAGRTPTTERGPHPIVRSQAPPPPAQTGQWGGGRSSILETPASGTDAAPAYGNQRRMRSHVQLRTCTPRRLQPCAQTHQHVQCSQGHAVPRCLHKGKGGPQTV
jgi:hypothetical protein